MATDRRGAAYRAGLPDDPGDWTDESDAGRNEHSLEDCCRGCGAHVSERFRRVFGTNEDIVWACLECSNYRGIQNGAAAGPDAQQVKL